jgi:hypothetical protein
MNLDTFVLCLVKCWIFIFFVLTPPNSKILILYFLFAPLQLNGQKSSLVQKILEGHSYAYGLQKHILLTDQNIAEQKRTEQC